MPNDCCTSCCIDGSTCQTVKSIHQDSLLRQIVASSMGSIISTVSLNPITVIKVRLQNNPVLKSATQFGMSEHSVRLSPFRDVIKQVVAQHGVAGFWAGTRTGIVMSVPNTVLYMSVYEKLKNTLAEESRLDPIRTITPAIAGAMARVVSVTIISPLELIRTIQTGGANGSIGVIARSIVKSEGIKGLYQGWMSSILRDCPFSAIYWGGFETLRPIYSNMFHSHLPPDERRRTGYPAYVTFLSGSTAGAIAAVCTHPFDVLKTRQQVGSWERGLGGSSGTRSSSNVNGTNNVNSNRSSSIRVSRGISNESSSGGGKGVGETKNADAIPSRTNITAENPKPHRPILSLASIVRTEGASALFRGLSMRMATVIPASAIMVTIYETIKKLDI